MLRHRDTSVVQEVVTALLVFYFFYSALRGVPGLAVFWPPNFRRRDKVASVRLRV